MDSVPYRAWSLLSLERTTRHAQGETRYSDEFGSSYAYDSKVANHAYVQAGDLVVLRGRTLVLGAGWVDSIDKSPGMKVEAHCACGSTNLKARKKLRPRFLCNRCGATFDEPGNRMTSVDVYTLHYGSRWREADSRFPVGQIDGIYVSRAEQNSIRELTAEAARSVIDAHLTTGDSWWESASDNGFDIPGGRRPATAYTRQGQQVFRELMLDRFGSACAFTGANPPGALEAAHLYMFSEAPEHDFAGGLLLRRDLHALFDRDLITIDPETWTIDVAPELHDYPALKALQDQPIQIHPSLRPSKNYLRRHAMRARATWTR
jgi:hypothetical protein